MDEVFSFDREAAQTKAPQRKRVPMPLEQQYPIQNILLQVIVVSVPLLKENGWQPVQRPGTEAIACSPRSANMVIQTLLWDFT